jgi:spore coat protein U-like protein
MNTARTILPSAIFILLFMASPVSAFFCSVSATGLSFGNYDIFSSASTDTIGTIEVSCNIPPQNPQAPLTVTISLSPGNSGSYALREMLPLSGGGDRLAYNVYTNASFSTIWGDGAGSSSILTNSVTRDTPWNATMYARIPPGQNVRAGSYSDLLTVTVEW